MIKFFRKIRQKLLQESRFSKYLLYAIGEIVLVMIGILLALQINNWNEGKKRRVEEIKALKELREGFKADTLDLNINLDALTYSFSSGDIILDQLNSNAQYHDSLGRHFANALSLTRLISQDGPYDVLKQKGLDLISNDSLRKQIINMHDASYESLRTWETGFFVSDRYIQEQCLDLFDVVQFFDMGPKSTGPAKMVPHDFEALKQNKRYKTMIKTFSNQSRIFHFHTQNTKAELKRLLEAIEVELKQLGQ